MITKLYIDGFKSFRQFSVEFMPMTVIAGTNASGKSNLFDALQLLSRLAETDLRTAFQEQRGNPMELFTQYEDHTFAERMTFRVEMLVDRTVRDMWKGEDSLKYTRLHYELSISRVKNHLGLEDLVVSKEELSRIKKEDDTWVKQLPKSARAIWAPVGSGGSGRPFIYMEEEDGASKIKIRQDGAGAGRAMPANVILQTAVAGVNSVDFPHVLAAQQEMRSWRFLQPISQDLREPTRKEPGMRDTISATGKNMAAALFRISQTDPYALQEISRKLNNFLPDYTEVLVHDDQANNQFIISVKDRHGREFSSRVLSEGTLNLLLLCILQYDEKHGGVLCFEEPENGIHPYRIRSMVALLRELSSDFSEGEEGLPLRQVIVNTHSPVVIKNVIGQQQGLVSVMFSQVATAIQDKKRLSITKMSRIDTSSQRSIDDIEAQRQGRITLELAIQYLQEANSEEEIKTLKKYE